MYKAKEKKCVVLWVVRVRKRAGLFMWESRYTREWLPEVGNESGGTNNIYSAVATAIPNFTGATDTLKQIVLLSDGNTTGKEDYYDSVVAAATANNVQIISIGYGDNTANKYSHLSSLATATGGRYYDVDNYHKAAELCKKKMNLGIDHDHDGIPDDYETNMILYNGTTLAMNPYLKDSDGDGLFDNEEVYLDIPPNPNGSKVTVIGKLYSNPTEPDTDGDELDDCIDARPLINDFVKLKSDYTSILNANNSSFGGNQDWYTDDAELNCVHKNGCGVIATADIMLYLLTKNENFSNQELLNWLSSQNRFNSEDIINENTYRTIICNLINSYYNVILGGVSTSDLANNLNKLSKDYNWNLHPTWNGNVNPDSFVDINIIDSQIRKDIPVVLCIDNSNIENYNFSEGEYTLNKAVRLYTKRSVFSHRETDVIYGYIDKHYVVVTGIIYKGNQAWLQVSSNGVEKYINYD